MKPISSPLLIAHGLLTRIGHAATAAGDHGRAFLANGLLRLTGIEISFRRAKAADARAIDAGIVKAENEIKAALSDDGIIDRREARRILAALKKPEHGASRLADELDLPAVHARVLVPAGLCAAQTPNGIPDSAIRITHTAL